MEGAEASKVQLGEGGVWMESRELVRVLKIYGKAGMEVTGRELA